MSKKLFCLVSFVLVLGLTTTVANADIADGLVAYWPLDEGGGTTTADASGNGNDGTLNLPGWDSGKFGGALNFDGVDDYVDCGNPSILDFGTGDFTISAWIKTTAPAGETIFGNGCCQPQHQNKRNQTKQFLRHNSPPSKKELK